MTLKWCHKRFYEYYKTYQVTFQAVIVLWLWWDLNGKSCSCSSHCDIPVWNDWLFFAELISQSFTFVFFFLITKLLQWQFVCVVKIAPQVILSTTISNDRTLQWRRSMVISHILSGAMKFKQKKRKIWTNLGSLIFWLLPCWAIKPRSFAKIPKLTSVLRNWFRKSCFVCLRIVFNRQDQHL